MTAQGQEQHQNEAGYLENWEPLQRTSSRHLKVKKKSPQESSLTALLSSFSVVCSENFLLGCFLAPAELLPHSLATKRRG